MTRILKYQIPLAIMVGFLISSGIFIYGLGMTVSQYAFYSILGAIGSSLFTRRTQCSRCGQRRLFFRDPTTWTEWSRGCWRCPQCNGLVLKNGHVSDG